VGGVEDSDVGAAATIDLHLAPHQTHVGPFRVLDIDRSRPEDVTHHVPVEQAVAGAVERRLVLPALEIPVYEQESGDGDGRGGQSGHHAEDDPSHCHPSTSPSISLSWHRCCRGQPSGSVR
jgi:hypothetical protein